MAPEVATESEITTKFDIWSLGMIVIEMLKGDHYWGSLGYGGTKVHHALMVKTQIHYRKISEIRDKISLNLSKLEANGEEYDIDNSPEFIFLDKCLEIDPELRWSADELLDKAFYIRASKPKYTLN